MHFLPSPLQRNRDLGLDLNFIQKKRISLEKEVVGLPNSRCPHIATEAGSEAETSQPSSPLPPSHQERGSPRGRSIARARAATHPSGAGTRRQQPLRRAGTAVLPGGPCAPALRLRVNVNWAAREQGRASWGACAACRFDACIYTPHRRSIAPCSQGASITESQNGRGWKGPLWVI